MQASNHTLLQTQDLAIGYFSKQKSKVLLSQLNLSLEQGKLTALIGVNGSGKSTLLRTLANLQTALEGDIFLDKKSIASYTRNEIAKKISLVLTDKTEVNLMTVKELVALGRYPYTDWLGKLGEGDKQIISHAMQTTQVADWSKEKVSQLSDGQQQKVWIARALAQDTPLLFLDEPTAHLDVINRLEIMLLLKKIAEEQQKAVLLATHDLAEVLQVAHHIWLIDKENNLISASPEEVIAQGIIEKNFTNQHIFFDRENKNFKVQF
jgi:iron complex transport system ATP-binding protein